jgi:hypothetical protein
MCSYWYNDSLFYAKINIKCTLIFLTFFCLYVLPELLEYGSNFLGLRSSEGEIAYFCRQLPKFPICLLNGYVTMLRRPDYKRWMAKNVLSFFLSPTSVYLTRLGVEGYYYSFDHTQGHTTVGRTPLDEWSARRPSTHTTLKTDMPPAEFEPAIPVGDRLQTLALDRSAPLESARKRTAQ